MRIYCTHCWDLLREVAVTPVHVGVTRIDFGYTEHQLRHTTQRVTPGFRPDYITRGGIWRRHVRLRSHKPRFS